MTDDNDITIPGLPDRSILFVSVVTHASHPLHGVARQHLYPAPDLDLAHYTKCIGPWVRRYFVEHVIDGTTDPLPQDLSRYRGVVIGCTLHYFNPARAPFAPWQDDLIKFARKVIDERLPFFGCCGGAYAGHLALGGSLAPNVKGSGIDPTAEGSLVIRTTPITLTEAGRADPLFRNFPPQFGMHGIHSDHVAQLAPGCCALAHSDDMPNQVIAYGERVRLLPGMHPELSDEFVRRGAAPLVNSGKFGTNPTNSEGMFALVARISPTPHANKHLLANFLTEFCAAKSPVSFQSASVEVAS
jgi:GMP synthase-like glutamine amidotransferase